MKEEMAWGFIALLKVGVIWLLILIGAIVAAYLVKRWWLRICLVLAALVSVPTYVMKHDATARKAEDEHWKSRGALAVKESEAWAKVCQLPPELKVHSAVPGGEQVDLRVREPTDFGGLGPDRPVWPKKTVCWMELPATSCTKANIANVQTEFVSTGSWCLNRPPGDKRDDCHTMWNISVADQKQERVQELTARYILEVHKPDRLSPLIDRFRVTVVDDKTNTMLAETVIHQKSWLGDIDRPPGTENEARHCPDRDEAIGKMLEAVFPGSSRARHQRL